MLAFASPQPKFLGGTRPPVPPIIAAPAVEDGKKKGRAQKVTQTLYFTYSWESPCEQIFTKLCMSKDMPDVLICAKIEVKKLMALGFTGGQILGSPIEMAVQPYYSGALPRSL